MKFQMKNFVLLLLLMIGSGAALAQPEGTKFGKISKEELSMAAYDKDPDAVAVVLYDVGNTRFNYNQSKGFQHIYERTTRIKILRKEGYDYSNVEVPYYVTSGAKEQISAIKASTYNLENGKEVEIKMEKNAIFEEKIDKHWRVTKFTLPGVREGSVIEYTYEVTSDFLFSLPEWEFQWDIPVVWSEYNLATPEYFRYVQIGQGYDPYDIQERDNKTRAISFLYSYDASSDSRVVNKRTASETVNYQDHTWRWVQKEVIAYQEEPYSPAREDLINKIEFQLASVSYPGAQVEQILPSWGKLAKEMIEDEDFGKFVKKGNAVKDIVAAETANLTDDKARIEVLQNYVKSNFRWNEYYRIYASQSVNDLLKTRLGNSADINLLLTLLLREAGINAHPVIISTRDHGKINQTYPLINKFNSVVTYVKTANGSFAIDATDPLLPSNMVTYQDLNGQGLLIGEEGYEWVNLDDHSKESAFNNVIVTFADGELNGTIYTGHKGYAAAKIRKAIQSKGETETANHYLKSYLTEVNVSKSAFENQTDPNASLKGTFEFNSGAHVEDVGDLVYINPMLGFGLQENPFKKPGRAFIVDFAHPTDDIYQFTLNVPEGYTVAEAPKPFRMSVQDGSLKFDYIVENKGTQVKLNYRLTRNRIQFTPEEYADLRNMYEEFAKHCAGQIVLKKL